MKKIFDFQDYKSYLRSALKERSKQQRGVRSRFAEAIQCRPGYVTQVLEGTSDLSIEQADLAGPFLGHTQEEDGYFLLLVLHERAGTKRLKERFKAQIIQILNNRENLKTRFQVKEISREHQMLFYSNWIYLAVLTILRIPQFRTKEAISSHLDLPLTKVSEIFSDLEEMGLIIMKNGHYSPTLSRSHLGKDSPMLVKHHTNWRIQAIQSIEKAKNGYHYSSLISVSEKDAKMIQERLTQALEEIAQIVAPSDDEKVLSLCMDFFEI